MQLIRACQLTAMGLVLMSGRAIAADKSAPLTDHQKALHVLNRLAFGPRPGDVERVETMGINQYIQQQLHPDTIGDAKADAAIARFETLSMSSSQLMDAMNADIKNYIQMQRMAGNSQEMKLRNGVDIGGDSKAAKAVEKPKSASDKLREATGHEATRAVGELQQAKLIRCATSERQLNEVLVDFWSNHFNIDVKKSSCQALKVADDRDAIRPHVLGKFRDLLGASAHSPAMLHYLDNNENSVARERSGFEKMAAAIYINYKLGIKSTGLISDREGPNENYGRELLELHTLGVDGGYTQKDVQEVARCFTGWSDDFLSGKFKFESNRHDNGEKVVLGHAIAAGGGIKDGEQVLDILASHPTTAKHISRQLCQRFVADEPSAELVDHVAQVFMKTDGDLRAVVEAIVTSPEFFSMTAYRSKIKSPLEFTISAMRATGATFVQPAVPAFAKLASLKEGANALGYGEDASASRKSVNRYIRDMGEPLFGCSPPTGYPEVSTKWVNPGALIDRLNFALALTEQNVIGVKSDILPISGADAHATVDQASQSLLHTEISSATEKVIIQNVTSGDGASKTINSVKLTALILGSPEFQRR